MIKRILPIALISFVMSCAAADLPAVYTLPAAKLAATRARSAAGDPAVQPTLAHLYQEADAALGFAAVAVTQKKRQMPSGDPHDYYSQSPYWWPNPATPDGLPFVNRDGQTYPASKHDTDSDNLWKLSQRAETLTLAYYFSGRSDYAVHAATLVRVWFLDPATRMNPNLRYAQVIPGHADMRGTGIIDARFLPNICNAVGLLRGSAAWSVADDKAFDQWLTDYLTWLTTSEQGRAEHAATNNHGVWYLSQAAGIAARLGHTEEVRGFCRETLDRIDRQIAPDGSQPLELKRTRSLHYCVFTLEAFVQLAVIGESVGVDVWGHVGPNGESLRAALAFLAPYVDPAKPWLKTDVVPEPRDRLLPLLASAQDHWSDAVFTDALRDFASSKADVAARWHLLVRDSTPPVAAKPSP